MIKSEQEDHWYFKYNGKEYPFIYGFCSHFMSFLKDGSFIFENQCVDLDKLVKESQIQLTEASIIYVIKFCQKDFQELSDEILLQNIIQIKYLAKILEIQVLNTHINDFISKQNKYDYNICLIQMDAYDVSNLNQVSEDLQIYIKKDKFLLLDIDKLYSILKINYTNKENSWDERDNDLIEFLFKITDKHKKKASPLYSFINLQNITKQNFSNLMNNYGNIIDFHFLNQSSTVCIFNLFNCLIKKNNKISSNVKKIRDSNEDNSNSIKINTNSIIHNKNEIDKIKKEIDLVKESIQTVNDTLVNLNTEMKLLKDFLSNFIHNDKKEKDSYKKESTNNCTQIKEVNNNCVQIKNDVDSKFIQINDEVNKNFAQIRKEIELNQKKNDGNFVSQRKSINDNNSAIIKINEINNKHNLLLRIACNTFENISFPEGEKKVGEGCFMNFQKLKRVILPNSVENICKNAFKDCICLTTINLPQSLHNIEDYAFFSCSSIERITIPDYVISIGDHAFEKCSKLIALSLPSSIKKIGNYAFSSCCSLKNINFEKSYRNYSRCSMNKFSSKEIGKFAFDNCSSLIRIDVSSFNTIGESAFKNCQNLINVDVPLNLKKIAAHMFDGCFSLKEFNFPKDLQSIDNYAFNGCSSLININFGDSLNTIGEYSFQNCKQLSKIIFPSSLTEIKQYAFNGCNSLNCTNIEDLPTLKSFGNMCFGACISLKQSCVDHIKSISPNALACKKSAPINSYARRSFSCQNNYIRASSPSRYSRLKKP